MKLAIVAGRPPWRPFVRWFVRCVEAEFPVCAILTVGETNRAKRRLNYLIEKHGILRAAPRVGAAWCYRRHTRRISEVQDRRFSMLVGDLVPASKCVDVGSLNSDAARDWFDEVRPDVVVPFEGGVIKPQMLARCRWIRWHHGMTPSVRGLASPFWAIYHQRPDWLGITIQELAKQIDAGLILGQRKLTVAPNSDLANIHSELDEFVIETLLRVLREQRDGTLEGKPCDTSQGRYLSSPTLRSLLLFPLRQRRFIRLYAGTANGSAQRTGPSPRGG